MEPVGSSGLPDDVTNGLSDATEAFTEEQLAREFSDFFIDSELIDLVLEDDS